MNALLQSLKSQKGATMVEYAIMVALIAVISIAIISVLGGQVQGTFSAVSSALANAGASG